MADFTLYALNDFSKFVKLKDIDANTGAVSSLTSGTVTVFFSTDNDSAAVTAHADLSNTATHIANGKWLIFFDASVLTKSVLDTAFSTDPPYMIVQYPNGFRVYFTGEYVESRAGTVG
jgi:hypothetical protein